jgi:hypothetical protein
MSETNVTINGNRVTISSADGDALRHSQRAATENPLYGATLTEALAWIDNAVVDLAGARIALKQLAGMLFVLRAQAQRDSQRR